MFIDRTLDAASAAQISLATQPVSRPSMAARLSQASASAWAVPATPRPIELLATIAVLALSLLALTGAIAETLTP